MLDVLQRGVCLLADFILLDADQGSEWRPLLESVCCVVSLIDVC